MEIAFEDRAMVLQDGDESVLLIADLHIGFHIDLSRRTGALLPPEHPQMIRRVQRLASKYNAAHLFILGDVKHSIGVDTSYNWEGIPTFMEKVQDVVDVTIVPGNHDGNLRPLLPRRVRVSSPRGIVVYHGEPSVAVMHGHAWPSQSTLEAQVLVMGHNHPGIRLTRSVTIPTGRGHELKRAVGLLPVVVRTTMNKNCVRRAQGLRERADARSTLFVLPSFNPLVSGIDVNKENATLQGPVFSSGCVDVQSSEVYSTQGILIGSLRDLQMRNSETIK